MACFNPLQGWRSRTANPSGKRSLVFNRNQGFEDQPVNVPCGQCIGCRLEKSRQWAIRCVHEAKLHEKNCFITLTYNNENLPPGGSLDKQAFPKFMKRLRKKYGSKIRYFHCGEYGESLGRPHYHACLFNHDFPDRAIWRNTPDGPLYTSQALSTLWPFGFSTIGEVTFASAAYTARYILKKVTGETKEDHYDGRVSEYTTCSKSIGYDYYNRFKTDIFPHDKCIIQGKQVNVPKYYRNKYEIENPEQSLKLKGLRIKSFKLHEKDNTIRRLRDRETVKLAQISNLNRGLENGD